MRHCSEAVEGFVERLMAGRSAEELRQELRDLDSVFESQEAVDVAVYQALARRNREDLYQEYLRVAEMCG
ncbi:MAG: hypothetical protein QJR01_06615 [Kyrpidia sp.]|nr:hypothetical protein [Kyrpidia sp.]